MPKEIAPAQMLLMNSPYPERTPADTSGVVRIYRFGSTFDPGFALEPGDLEWPAGVKSASANADSERQQGGRMSELSIETPDEDAAEQALEVPEEDGEERSE